MTIYGYPEEKVDVDHYWDLKVFDYKEETKSPDSEL